MSNFSSLSDGEVNYHLHIANTHSGVTQAKSKDMCKISRHMEKQSQHEKVEALEATINAFNRALQETLSNTGGVGNTTQINSVVGDINRSVRESMNSHYAFADQAQEIAQPLDYNIIRRSYIEGPSSIMKNLPMPEVSLLHGCTHIPASQIVNHFLAP